MCQVGVKVGYMPVSTALAWNLEANMKVKGLYQSGKQWTWWIPTGTGQYECYETNIMREGIFQVNEATLERTQITGTCQFSLRGCSRSAAYHRIARWFYEEVE